MLRTLDRLYRMDSRSLFLVNTKKYSASILNGIQKSPYSAANRTYRMVTSRKPNLLWINLHEIVLTGKHIGIIVATATTAYFVLRDSGVPERATGDVHQSTSTRDFRSSTVLSKASISTLGSMFNG